MPVALALAGCGDNIDRSFVLDELAPTEAGPGALVVLRGAGLVGEMSTVVTFAPGIAAAIVHAEPDLLVVEVPDGVIAGDVTVTVDGDALPPLAFAPAPGFVVPRGGPAPVFVASGGRRYVTDEVVMILSAHRGPADARAIATRFRAELAAYIPAPNLYVLRLGSVPEIEPVLDGVLRELARQSGVETVARQPVLAPFATTPTDVDLHPQRAPLWAFDRMNAQRAWDIAADSGALADAPVRALVVDTNIHHHPSNASWPQHPELVAPGALTVTVDIAPGADDPYPGGAWHGMAVAGLLAAANDPAGDSDPSGWLDGNGVVTGVAPRVDLAVEALGRDFTAATALAAIDRASQPHQVVTLGFGVADDEEIVDPLRYAFARVFARHPDTLYVSAAGNHGIDAAAVVPASVGGPHDRFMTVWRDRWITLPVTVTNHITVGGIDQLDARWMTDRAHASNFGAVVDIAAPSRDLFTVLWEADLDGDGAIAQASGFDAEDIDGDGVIESDGHALASGTSLAAPQVAGAAALLWNLGDAPATPADVIALLVETARPIDPAYAIGGRLDLCGAVARRIGRDPDVACRAGILVAAIEPGSLFGRGYFAAQTDGSAWRQIGTRDPRGWTTRTLPSPDGATFVTIDRDRLERWSIHGTRLGAWSVPDGWGERGMAWHPDGRLIAAGAGWWIATPLDAFDPVTGAMTSIGTVINAWDFDGARLATFDDAGQATIDGAPAHEPDAPCELASDDPVVAGAYTRCTVWGSTTEIVLVPGGGVVLSGNATFHRPDPAEPTGWSSVTLYGVFHAAPGAIRHLAADGSGPIALSPDGASILYTVYWWDETVRAVPLAGGPSRFITYGRIFGNDRATFSPDGSRVLVGRHDWSGYTTIASVELATGATFDISPPLSTVFGAHFVAGGE
jgi:hypothetical protein